MLPVWLHVPALQVVQIMLLLKRPLIHYLPFNPIYKAGGRVRICDPPCKQIRVSLISFSQLRPLSRDRVHASEKFSHSFWPIRLQRFSYASFDTIVVAENRKSSVKPMVTVHVCVLEMKNTESVLQNIAQQSAFCICLWYYSRNFHGNKLIIDSLNALKQCFSLSFWPFAQ